MNTIQLIALIEDDMKSSTFELNSMCGILKTDALKHDLHYYNIAPDNVISYYMRNYSSTEMLIVFVLHLMIDGEIQNFYVSFTSPYTVKIQMGIYYSFINPVLYKVAIGKEPEFIWDNDTVIVDGKVADINNPDEQLKLTGQGRTECKDIMLAVQNKTYKESI